MKARSAARGVLFCPCYAGAIGGAFLLIVTAGALAWYMARDPLAILAHAGGPPTVLTDDIRTVEGRILRDVVLETGQLGQAHIRLSLPHPMPDERMPVVLVLGGLRTGADSVSLIRDAGRNVLVGYDWPLPSRLPRGLELLYGLLSLRSRVLHVPGQVEAALRWIVRQPWADGERISLVGFSLGALAAPAVQRLLEARGHRLGWTVLAYGGAPLGELAAHHPRVRPDWMRPVVRDVINIALRPLEPALHLPRLGGCFFLLSGSADELIPAGAATRLAELAPSCKSLTTIQGAHLGMGPDEASLLEQAMRASAAWLVSQGAINSMAALSAPAAAIGHHPRPSSGDGLPSARGHATGRSER